MGELITLDDGVEAYLTGSGGTGVLFHMDALALRPRIYEMADRIASWGYLVLAPNLFHRHGTVDELAPARDLADPGAREEHIEKVMPLVRAHTPADAAADTLLYVRALREQGATDGLGLTGYCFGGHLALRAACQLPDEFAAAGSFHAGRLAQDTPVSVHRLVHQARAELYVAHADHDASMPPEAIAAFDEALGRTDLVYTSVVYPAAHGWTMSDTPVYDEEATERHYRALDDLFGRNL